MLDPFLAFARIGEFLDRDRQARLNPMFASAELYDAATNTWSAAASLTTARQNHTATLLPSGQVLVAGGYNGIVKPRTSYARDGGGKKSD